MTSALLNCWYGSKHSILCTKGFLGHVTIGCLADHTSNRYLIVCASYNRRLSTQAIHRGDLFLLRACPQPGFPLCFQQQPKSWLFSVVSQKKMPDPVIAVAQLTDDLLVASIGLRLVCYKVSGKSWEKKGWITTHDTITRLSADNESMVVAAGDAYNSVVLYKYSEEFEEFEVNPRVFVLWKLTDFLFMVLTDSIFLFWNASGDLF